MVKKGRIVGPSPRKKSVKRRIKRIQSPTPATREEVAELRRRLNSLMKLVVKIDDRTRSYRNFSGGGAGGGPR